MKLTNTYASNGGNASSGVAASGQAVYNAYSAARKITELTLTSYTSSSYKSTITTDNLRYYNSLYLVVVSAMSTLVLSSDISSGTTITIATLNSHKPAQRTPMSIFLSTTVSRRYIGSINADGTVVIIPDSDMPTGTYYIYFQCVYIESK